MASSKLYIYDSSSSIDRKQAAGRFAAGTVETLAAASVKDLKDGLSNLASQGKTFKRVLFQTHGNSGMIFFNHEAITAGDLKKNFLGYDKLFPNRAKLYFDGCNVADGKAGWEFLAAVGQVFLPNQGGIAMGYTSLGGGIPGWLPGIGGHTVHLWGELRFIEFGTGGKELSRFAGGDASVIDAVAAVQKLESF